MNHNERPSTIELLKHKPFSIPMAIITIILGILTGGLFFVGAGVVLATWFVLDIVTGKITL